MSEHPPRVYLITPPLSDADGFAPLLAEALGACDVACVLVRMAARDQGEAKKIVRALAPVVQDRDIALLVEGDAQLAARAGADGCHVAAGEQAAREAISALKPERIVGVGAIAGRDAAMSAGEAGADYLMFGGPDDPQTQEEILERVAWWAEIFNVPCVAYAHRLADVGALAGAGADFIALGEAVFGDPRGPAAALSEAEAAMANAREQAH